MLTFNFTYDSLGRRTSLSMPNGTTTSYSYDSLSRLTNLSTLNSQLQSINSNTYTYDSVGNKLTKQDLTENNNYTYDSTYQLLQVTTPTTNAKGKPKEKKLETYTYDSVGNRLIGPKQNHQYTSNANNQITQIQNPNNQTQFQYDNNGNRYIETETKQDGVTTTTYYSYDYEGRLTRVEIRKENLQKEITYTYDPFGRRLSKTIHKEEIDADGNEIDLTLPRTTYYVYDNEDIIMEYNQKGKTIAAYTHGLGIDEPLSFTNKKGETYFYHADGLGSVVALSDNTGTVVQTYTYDSFGNIVNQTGTINQPYTFTGREYDSESGLYFLRARELDSKTGTFTQKDPIGFAAGDTNLYRYVFNSPVNYTDPLGLAGPAAIAAPVVVAEAAKDAVIIGGLTVAYLYFVSPEGKAIISKTAEDVIKEIKEWADNRLKKSKCETRQPSGPPEDPNKKPSEDPKLIWKIIISKLLQLLHQAEDFLKH